DTSGHPVVSGNTRIRSTKPVSANPQVHSRGDLLAGLPTEESHDFSRAEDVKRKNAWNNESMGHEGRYIYCD
ncbi:MAG: hypothetical protein ABEI06_04100, partial [Halobacteriaceae archaeon]